MSGIYRTRSQGVAAALRYAFGPESHRATFAAEQKCGIVFRFDDTNNEAAPIASAFHKDRGESGFSVSDSKVLINEFLPVRKTMTAAIEAVNKTWRIDNEQQN